jgi:hypothetical protein
MILTGRTRQWRQNTSSILLDNTHLTEKDKQQMVARMAAVPDARAVVYILALQHWQHRALPVALAEIEALPSMQGCCMDVAAPSSSTFHEYVSDCGKPTEDATAWCQWHAGVFTVGNIQSSQELQVEVEDRLSAVPLLAVMRLRVVQSRTSSRTASMQLWKRSGERYGNEWCTLPAPPGPPVSQDSS